MSDMAQTSRKRWIDPSLKVYGSVKEITQVQQSKSKTFGSGDDVLVNNQAILSPLGS